MSTTIDHLESHHRYTVIRGFTDLNGLHIPFETTAVIRRMDVDPGFTRLSIDWERDGPNGAIIPERLIFDFRAPDGPRNNHMREYFEKGEVVMPPREPQSSKTQGPPTFAEAELSEPAVAEDKSATVQCGCPPLFHRAVWPGASNVSVNACLRCGVLTVANQVGDDGRHTGNAWTAYIPLHTPRHITDWLARFPRVAIHYGGGPWRWPMAAELVRYPMLFYPADARVRDEDELARLEATLDAAQSPLTRADRQVSACGDIPEPPADLAENFYPYRVVQSALGLRASSDVAALRSHAHLRSPSTEMAASLLLRRPDAYDLMMDWLSSKDDAVFSAGVAMLRDSRPLFSGPEDPKLTPEILAILNAMPTGKLKDVPTRIESAYRFEAVLVAIADLGANAMLMQDGLRALRVKLARRDATLVDAMAAVLDELNGKQRRPL